MALASRARGDRPYAPSRNYDLQNVRTHLWFDIEHRAIRGEVTETISILQDGTSKLSFDSADLDVSSVAVDGKAAAFSVEPQHLIVILRRPAERGKRHNVFIRYHGQPKKGLFFILPDKNYPRQPVEVWTQGEAEDTHYYIPIYDYPNDRTTSEMILTVPSSWITVSNGKLVSVRKESDGMKTWDWKQSQPLSTYLISLVAGQFVEREERWHGVVLRYLVPQGDAADIGPTFAHTKAMLSLFTSTLGVPYPWKQYAQTSVDDFTEGGMENTSAATLSVSDLVDPRLAREYRTGADEVNSHELSHQWFGDLVTCKDWANLWLNEGFATFFQNYWLERESGPEEAAYEYWREERQWFQRTGLFSLPIVTRNFHDSMQNAGNTYQKSAWVLKMLREKLGDNQFFQGLRDYLEVNRGKNVVTADLQEAIEQATSVDVDRFFDQWIYGAGAPKLEIKYTYDAAAHEVRLNVRQTQKIHDAVGLFEFPAEVSITTPSGGEEYPVHIHRADETFSFPSSAVPLMLLFDPGDKIFKQAEFEKPAAMLIYQLQHARSVPDRADAALALGRIQNDPAVIVALGASAKSDPFWGVRVEALRALANLGGAGAEQDAIAATTDPKPWVREAAAAELTYFASDSAVAGKLIEMIRSDPAYRVRAAAIRALAETRSPRAFAVLASAAGTDSPGDVIRTAALESFAILGDSRALPVLLNWSAPGKPFVCREAAIDSLGTLGESNAAITRALLSYLREPYFDIQLATISALTRRGDPAATGPLESLLHGDEATSVEDPYIRTALDVLEGNSPAN